MLTPNEVRDALRTLHGSAPEAASLVEAHLDDLEDQVNLLANEDAFRAFVLEQARQAGATQSLLNRLDASLLRDVIALELARSELALQDAQDRATKAVTLQNAITQPVVLAVIGVLSTALTGIISLALRIYGSGS